MTAVYRPIPIALIAVSLVVVILGNSTASGPGNSQQAVSETTTVMLTSMLQTTIQPTVVTTQTETAIVSYLPQGITETLAFFFIAAFLLTTLLLVRARRSRPIRNRFCVNCGAELKLGSRFCGKCGAKQVQT